MPWSPRRRRRLARLAAAGLVVLLAALGVALMPRKTGSPPERFTSEPIQVVASPRPVPLRASDRRAIDATLDRFVPAAVERRAPAVAYDLSTDALRGGDTRRQWSRGAIPVFPYRARGRQFHGWRVNYSYASEVSLDLLLQPRRGTRAGPLSYTVVLKRGRGRWLVDSFLPVASFSAPNRRSRVLAQPDLAPSQLSSGRGRLGATWLVVPLAIVSLVPIVLLGALLRSVLRGRRAVREHRRHAELSSGG